MPARPPPVPTLTADLCADPVRLAKVLDQFARDVNGFARAVNDAGTGADGEDGADGADGINTPHASARRTGSTQTIPKGTVTVIVCNTEDYDTDGIYEPTTGVVTVVEPGWYTFRWSIALTFPSNAFYVAISGLRIDGTQYVAGIHTPVDLQSAPAAYYRDLAVPASRTLHLTAGQTVELYGYQSNAGSDSATVRYADDVTYFEVQRVRR